MNMSLFSKSEVCAVIVAGILANCPVLAQAPQQILVDPQAPQNTPAPVGADNPELRTSLARDPGGHWTSENLFRAVPLDLPRPTTPKAQFLLAPATQSSAAIPALKSQDGKIVAKDQEIAPDLSDRLFTTAKKPPAAASTSPTEDGPVAADFGSSGAQFSSSRLIPVDARLEYPYRAVGKLFFNKPNEGDFICSGAVIAPRLVLTAGHCVHRGNGGTGGYYQRFLFVPAYHQGQSPYQAWNFTWVITTTTWANGNGAVPNAADFAILELEDRRFGTDPRSIGQVTGTLGYRTNGLMPNQTKLLGYPANLDSGEVMHQVDAASSRSADQSTVLYGSDMGGGSSGGPWVENFGVKAEGQTGGLNANPNRIVGVTSYGYTAADPKVQGSSILNQEFTVLLNAACAHRPGNCQ